MRHTFPALALALSLAACAGGGTVSQDPLQNPLVAEQEEAELIEHLVNMQIRNDPSMQNPEIRRAVDDARAAALKRSEAASAKVRAGILGGFQSVGEETKGSALIHEDTLYFSTDFLVTPGIDVHVYVTRAVDPRELPAFPDETAVDVGSLRTPYGPQAYAVPLIPALPPATGTGAAPAASEDSVPELRHASVVIYDEALKRIHGFAQLRP